MLLTAQRTYARHEHLQSIMISRHHSNLQGVANRDIKLENTLLDSTTRPLIKICDFGYSKVRPTLAALSAPQLYVHISSPQQQFPCAHTWSHSLLSAACLTSPSLSATPAACRVGGNQRLICLLSCQPLAHDHW